MRLAVIRVVTTILLVDDDPGVRYALTEVLRDRGYRVVGVDSGAKALAMLDGVDVVVTDLSMPGMDGLELVSQIAARAPALPVILFSSK
jgi:CheY-like chemotaxis protein